MFDYTARVTRPDTSLSAAYYRSKTRPPACTQLALLDRPEVTKVNTQMAVRDPESDVATASTENHGEVFTLRWVADMILDLVGYDVQRDLATTRALEPACGHGAFLVPMVQRLIKSCQLHQRPLTHAASSIRAYDLLPANVAVARTAIVALLQKHGTPEVDATALAAGWVQQGDFLLGDHEVGVYDICVGNPPYLRLEDVPESRSNAYRRACTTMGGRADIFVGFYEAGLKSLAAQGRLGFICADRWMRNAYGRRLRALVSENYAVDAVISMHDVDAFERAVSAYPAVTILRAGEQRSALVADTSRSFGLRAAETLVAWARKEDAGSLRVDGLKAAWLPRWFDTADGWPTGSPDRLALVADIEARFAPLEAVGAKVGIGIASGADNVYVVSDGQPIEPERMLPMVMAKDLTSGSVEWSGHYLVNPWTMMVS